MISLLSSQMPSKKIGQLGAIHLVIGDFNEGFVRLLLRQPAGVHAVKLHEVEGGSGTSSLVAIPIRMIRNDVVGVGGGNLEEVAATKAIGALGLIDSGFRKMLVQYSVVAAVG